METTCRTCNRQIAEHTGWQLDVCLLSTDEDWCLACHRWFDEHTATALAHCLEVLEAACVELGVD